MSGKRAWRRASGWAASKAPAASCSLSSAGACWSNHGGIQSKQCGAPIPFRAPPPCWPAAVLLATVETGSWAPRGHSTSSDTFALPTQAISHVVRRTQAKRQGPAAFRAQGDCGSAEEGGTWAHQAQGVGLGLAEAAPGWWEAAAPERWRRLRSAVSLRGCGLHPSSSRPPAPRRRLMPCPCPAPGAAAPDGRLLHAAQGERAEEQAAEARPLARLPGRAGHQPRPIARQPGRGGQQGRRGAQHPARGRGGRGAGRRGCSQGGCCGCCG